MLRLVPLMVKVIRNVCDAAVIGAESKKVLVRVVSVDCHVTPDEGESVTPPVVKVGGSTVRVVPAV